MNIVIQSSIHTLNKALALLSSITNNQLCDTSIPPYNSCIGSHIRHILDFYDCILEGIESGSIDLTDRRRDEEMHKNCIYARTNIERVIDDLKDLDLSKFNNSYEVSDDLGLGKVTIEYTLGAILAQANSHAIHHYAIINYILDRLGIKVSDDTFGYNPTTPKARVKLN